MKKILVTVIAMALVLAMLVSCAPAAQDPAPTTPDDPAPAAAEPAPAEADPDPEPAEPAPEEAVEEPPASGGISTQGEAVDIAMVTFMTGIPYFDEASKGAFKAGETLRLDVGYFDPSSNDTPGEIALIDDLITQGVKGLVVTAMDSAAVVPVLQKAMDAGIKVVTFDLDTDPEGREMYAGLKEMADMGPWMVDLMYEYHAPVLGEEFEYSIITSSLTSQLMIDRVEAMIDYQKENYPGLTCVGYEAGDSDSQKTYNAAVTLMTANPDMQVILSNASDALGPICEAITAEGKIDTVYGTGMTTPNLAKPGYESGAIIGGAMLWDPAKWAEFAVTVCNQLIEGETFSMDGDFEVPGFPEIEMISDDVIVYSGLQEFTKENINDFDF